uniref:Uncharacterized protein n=1 Tax=Cacopsylla melanoneura TaxID=428564 RepID=A0A8D8SKD0_9HEMI
MYTQNPELCFRIFVETFRQASRFIWYNGTWQKHDNIILFRFYLCYRFFMLQIPLQFSFFSSSTLSLSLFFTLSLSLTFFQSHLSYSTTLHSLSLFLSVDVVTR